MGRYKTMSILSEPPPQTCTSTNPHKWVIPFNLLWLIWLRMIDPMCLTPIYTLPLVKINENQARYSERGRQQRQSTMAQNSQGERAVNSTPLPPALHTVLNPSQMPNTYMHAHTYTTTHTQRSCCCFWVKKEGRGWWTSQTTMCEWLQISITRRSAVTLDRWRRGRDLEGWGRLLCSHSSQSCYPIHFLPLFFLFLKLMCPNPNMSVDKKRHQQAWGAILRFIIIL